MRLALVLVAAAAVVGCGSVTPVDVDAAAGADVVEVLEHDAGVDVVAEAPALERDAGTDVGEVLEHDVGDDHPPMLRTRPLDLPSCNTSDAYPYAPFCLTYSDGTRCSLDCVINGDFLDGPCYAPRTWDGMSSDSGPATICLNHNTSCASCP